MKIINISKIFAVFFLITTVTGMLVLSCPGKSLAQELGDDVSAQSTEDDNPVYAARDSVLAYFYSVSGVVAAVERDVVKVNFRTDKKLTKGMRFSVFREGKPFYHPITKELIGKSEEFIGRVEINKVGEKSYLCRSVSGSPKVGDIVRITSSRIKLAFFQDKQAEWTLSEIFYNSLKDSGRFDFLESYTESYDPEELSELARMLGAEAVLLFSTLLKDGNIFLNVKLFWAEDAAAFTEIEEMVGPSLVAELTSWDDIISLSSIEGEPWGSYELVGGELIAMGDVDGNSEKELVVSDGYNIRIYSYKEEPQEIWFVEGRKGEKHIFIDVLDLNKNGRAEIFVTSLRDKKTMSSFVLEYDLAEGYKRIWDKTPYCLRVIGSNLFMQVFTRHRQFSGPVYKAVWKDGHYQTDRPVELPEGVNIYGFINVDWQNSGHSHVLAFDDSGYLNLYSGSELIWRSEDSYMRFDRSFDKDDKGIVTLEEKWFAKGRLLRVITKHGQEVLVIKKIPFLSMVPGLGYKNTEVYSLWWDGEEMNETLILSGMNGAVSDYWLEQNRLLLIAESNLSVFLTNSLSGNFMRGSTLYFYNLTGK